MRGPIKIDVWRNYFKDPLIQRADFQTQQLNTSQIKFVTEDLVELESEITVDEVMGVSKKSTCSQRVVACADSMTGSFHPAL